MPDRFRCFFSLPGSSAMASEVDAFDRGVEWQRQHAREKRHKRRERRQRREEGARLSNDPNYIDRQNAARGYGDRDEYSDYEDRNRYRKPQGAPRANRTSERYDQALPRQQQQQVQHRQPPAPSQPPIPPSTPKKRAQQTTQGPPPGQQHYMSEALPHQSDSVTRHAESTPDNWPEHMLGRNDSDPENRGRRRNRDETPVQSPPRGQPGPVSAGSKQSQTRGAPASPGPRGAMAQNNGSSFPRGILKRYSAQHQGPASYNPSPSQYSPHSADDDPYDPA